MAPNQALLGDWKAGSITQEQYIERYREQLKSSWGKVHQWLCSLNPNENSTLQCWEPKNQFCHRNLVALLVKRHRPDCFGGCDIVRIAMEQCERCDQKLIPGLDASFCQNCHSWYRHRFSA